MPDEQPSEPVALFRKEAVASVRRQNVLGEVSVQQPLKVKTFAVAIGVLLVASVAFMATAEYPRRVAAKGYLTSADALAYVYATRSGYVAQSMVEEGSVVRVNAPLMRLTSPSDLGDAGDLNEVIAQELAFRIGELETQQSVQLEQYERLESALLGAVSRREEELAELGAAEGLQRQQIRIAGERYRSLIRAFEQKAISRASMLEQRLEVLRLQVALSSTRQRRSSLAAGIAEDVRAVERLRLEQTNASRTLTMAVSEARERLAGSEYAKGLTIKAPVPGVVSAVQFRVGESVRVGDVLCAIAPSEALTGILHLPSDSAALVEEGRDVQLVFDAFPAAEFGSLAGQLTSVATVPIEPELLEGPIRADGPMYVASLSILSRGEEGASRIRLLPGMAFTAHIALEERTLGEWLLEPVLDALRSRPGRSHG